MMTNHDSEPQERQAEISSFQGVVLTVFEDFLEQLEKSGDIDRTVVARLRQELLEKGNLTQPALQRAIFADEELP